MCYFDIHCCTIFFIVCRTVSGAAACPIGYNFSLPVTPLQNYALRAVAGARDAEYVWIDMRFDNDAQEWSPFFARDRGDVVGRAPAPTGKNNFEPEKKNSLSLTISLTTHNQYNINATLEKKDLGLFQCLYHLRQRRLALLRLRLF